MTITKSGRALLTDAIKNDGVAVKGDGGLQGGAFKKVAASLVASGHLTARDGKDDEFLVTDAGRAALADTGTAGGENGAGGTEGATAAKPPRTPRENSKQAQLIVALQDPNGVTIDELSTKFGWLPHTTRAAITGLSKKGLTEKPTSEKVEGRGRVYKLAVAA